MKTLTPLELWSLMAATVFNLYTYRLANQARLMGMTLKRSAVLTQTGTSVANTLPAGSYGSDTRGGNWVAVGPLADQGRISDGGTRGTAKAAAEQRDRH
jgi:hypothetical protein